MSVALPLFWKTRSDRIRLAGRFDAEHFDPRFDDLEKRLKANKRWSPLGDLAGLIRRGVQPEYIADGEIIVLNSKHVGGLLDIAHAERTSQAFWENHPRGRATKFDVLVNATGVGTIGRSSCVLHASSTLVDNHVTIIRELDPECDPVYLSIFLGSQAGMMQTEKWLSGSSGQVEVYPGDFRNFIVPLPDVDIQRGIRRTVISAYESLVRSGELTRSAEADLEKEIRVPRYKG